MAELYGDIPRFYTALAEWSACMVYFCILKREEMRWKDVGICGIFLVFQSLLLLGTGTLPMVFWIPCMLVAAASMYAFLYTSCTGSPVTAGYCCAQAFLMAEFAASFEWQLHCYLFAAIGYGSIWLQILFLLFVYAVVFLSDWLLQKRLFVKDSNFLISQRELWSAIAIVIAAFAFSNLSFIYHNTPFSARFAADIFNIRTLVDLGGIAILYAFESRICELRAEKELSSINATLKSQYDHYRYYQESVEMINMKYHDLKHQIAGLRAETDGAKRKEWLDSMERELDLYETSQKTGNQVLDTLLAGKRSQCKKHGIEMTCVADGRLLNFMHVTDICTIFGNALDNAIESVIMLPDVEKRLIHLSVSSRKNFLFIQVENYCEQVVKMEGNFPMTTKTDKINHGYGLKSIRYTTEKYGGTVTASLNQNWFELKILIPEKE